MSKLLPVSGLTLMLGAMLPAVAGPANSSSSRFGMAIAAAEADERIHLPAGIATMPMSPVRARRVIDSPLTSGSVAGSMAGTAPATTGARS